MLTLRPDARALIESDALVHLVTLNPDGSPQLSCVWAGLEGEEIVSGHMAMRQKIANSLSPSMRAASRKSLGTVSKNCFIRNVPNAVIMPGNMIPQYVLIQPYALDMTYQGMTSISVGIISVARTRIM